MLCTNLSSPFLCSLVVVVETRRSVDLSAVFLLFLARFSYFMRELDFKGAVKVNYHKTVVGYVNFNVAAKVNYLARPYAFVCPFC